MQVHKNYWAIGVLILAMGLSACDRLRSVDTIVSRGEQQYEKGNYRAAIGDFKTALERDGGNLVARSYLARISYHLADFEAAQDSVEAVLAGGVHEPDIVELKYQILLARRQYTEALRSLESERLLSDAHRLLYTGQAQAELGNTSEAFSAFEQGLSVMPADTALLVAQARLYAGMNDLPHADANIAAALKIEQTNASAWLVSGGLLVAKGDLANAVAALERAEKFGQKQLNWQEQARLYALLADVSLRMRNVDAATRWIANLDSRTPQIPLAFYLKARLALLKNNANDALMQLQKAVQLGDFLPADLLLANLLIMQSSYEQAEEQLNKLHSDHPGNVEVRKLLAQLYLATKRPDKANEVLPQSEQAEAAPDAQVDWLRGQSLLAIGSSDAGIAMLEKSVASSANDTTHALQLARAYIMTGKRDKALGLLNSLPADAGGKQRQSLLVLASVMGKSASDATRDIQALLVRYPNDSNLTAAAGAVYAQTGDMPSAMKLFNKAVSLDARNIDARMAMASLYMQAKQFDQAEVQLRAVLAQDTKQVSAHLGLAKLALAKGNKAQATKELEAAIGTDPAAVEPRLELAQIAITNKDMQRAYALLDQAVAASNNAPAVTNAAGNLLFQAKQYEEALTRFEQAAAAGLKSARISVAQVNLALGQNAEAQTKLEAAATDPETQVQAVAILVQQDVRAGKLPVALQRIERLRQNKVAAQFVEELSGDAYALATQFNSAAASYERAAKLAPNQRLIIKQYQARIEGKLANPTAPLVTWLATKPDDIAVRRLLAGYLLQSADNVAAAREFERILAASPVRNPAELNNLAWLYQQLKDPRAEATAREAYQAAGNDPAIADTYGWILLNAGKVAEALPMLEKAAAAAKTDFEIQYHLAAAQTRSGQKEQARTLLQGLLANQQAFVSRMDAEHLLKSLDQ